MQLREMLGETRLKAEGALIAGLTENQVKTLRADLMQILSNLNTEEKQAE